MTEVEEKTQDIRDELSKLTNEFSCVLSKRASEMELEFQSLARTVLKKYLKDESVDFMEWFPDEAFKSVKMPEGYDIDNKSTDEIRNDCCEIKSTHIKELIALADTISFDGEGGISIGKPTEVSKDEPDPEEAFMNATEEEEEEEEQVVPAGLGAALANLAKKKEDMANIGVRVQTEPEPEPEPEPEGDWKEGLQILDSKYDELYKGMKQYADVIKKIVARNKEQEARIASLESSLEQLISAING
jgi:hypothetical protein